MNLLTVPVLVGRHIHLVARVATELREPLMELDAQKVRKVPRTSLWRSDFSVKVVLITLAVFVVLCFGMNVNLFRSEAWIPRSIWATALINVLPTALLMRIAMHYRQGFKGMRFNLFTGAMVAALLYALSLLVTYFLVAFTIPEVFTRFSGTPFETHDVPFITREGYGCRHEVYSPTFDIGGPRGYYCPGSDEYAALGKEGVAHVYGRQSWFGRHIDYMELEQGPRL